MSQTTDSALSPTSPQRLPPSPPPSTTHLPLRGLEHCSHRIGVALLDRGQLAGTEAKQGLALRMAWELHRGYCCRIGIRH